MEAAHIFPSFLARDIRDGRLGVQVSRYTARLLVRDAKGIIARFWPTVSIYLDMGRRLHDHAGGGEDSGDGPGNCPGDYRDQPFETVVGDGEIFELLAPANKVLTGE